MQKKDLIELNRTRKLVGLPLINVKRRQCNVCGKMFDSVGDRTCGECSKTRRKIPATFCGRQLY